LSSLAVSEYKYTTLNQTKLAYHKHAEKLFSISYLKDIEKSAKCANHIVQRYHACAEYFPVD